MSENENENEKPKELSKEEKLNKDEFRQLIPHLECNQLFLIEIKCSGKWQYLFDDHYENKALTKLTCTACSEDLNVNEFEKHLQSSTHLGALEKVESFYHPLFTSEQKNALSEEKSGTTGDRNMKKANGIAAKIELVGRRDSYIAEVTLPMEDLLKVKFQRKKEGIWENLITTQSKPNKRSKFVCMICNLACRGVIPLNQHLHGASHRFQQSEVHEISVPKYEHLTKYCLYSYSFTKSYGFKSLKLKKESATKTEQKEYKKEKDDVKKESSSRSKKGVGEEKRDLLSLNKDSKNGLVGVEYVAQLESDSQPGSYLYACCLCDTVIMTTAEMMEKHLISFDHRLKYLELYYSDTIENFKRMLSDCRASYSKAMPFVLERIALGIDKYHGYGTPHRTTESKFKKSRKEVGEELHGLPHACQEFGPSFSNAVTAQEIRDLKKSPLQKQLESESVDTPVRFIVRNRKKYYLNMRYHVSRPIEKKRAEIETDNHSKALSVRRKKYSEKRSRSPSHEYIESKRKSISRRRESYGATDIWSVYRDLISKAAVELESLYVGYRKQPEKHPLYDQEWNSFWKRRKEELMLEGKNYRSYNFQPEWTTYFRQRLEQMFGEDLQKSKLNVRHRLNIPIDAEEDSFPTPQSQTCTTPYGVDQSYSENMWDRSFISHRSEEQPQADSVPKKFDKPTVIHMLRLMTALEEHLGNLGTKVLELLTKAVSLEKFYAADSPELEKQILTSSNYKLLKIAVEKLKSKLYADLIEGNKINSFKRVIDCSEVILKKAEMMGWANEAELTIDNDNTQIKKLIEVLQEKKDVSPSINKKSLSDALMEVISQKKLKDTPLNSQMGHTQMEKQNASFSNNIPPNYYSGVSTPNFSYNPRNFGAGPSNRSSVSTRGLGNNIHFNSQYGNNSSGNANMQWPDADARYNYPPHNHGPNSAFMNIHSNGSNIANWRS